MTSDVEAGGPAPPVPGPSAGARRRDEAHVARVGAEVGEPVRKALAYVLRSTKARPQTEAELRAKLARRDVDDDTAEAALEQARRLRAVDDEAIARAIVEERGLRQGFGVARVREELDRRRVPPGLAEDALAVLDDRDDEAVARELAERRLAQLPTGIAPQVAARRVAAYLARRGHPAGLAQRVAISVSGLDRRWD